VCNLQWGRTPHLYPLCVVRLTTDMTLFAFVFYRVNHWCEKWNKWDWVCGYYPRGWLRNTVRGMLVGLWVSVMHECNRKRYQPLHAHMRENLNQGTGCFSIHLLPSLIEWIVTVPIARMPLLLLHFDVWEVATNNLRSFCWCPYYSWKRCKQNKVKLSMIKGCEFVWDSEGMNPCARNLGIRCRRVISFTPRSLYPRLNTVRSAEEETGLAA
jgi:hypothetical protein